MGTSGRGERKRRGQRGHYMIKICTYENRIEPGILLSIVCKREDEKESQRDNLIKVYYMYGNIKNCTINKHQKNDITEAF
jgi:hypothetical protein